VKIMNFEEYPSIATRGTATRFITVQVNCTKFVADFNRNYIVNSECPFNGGWIFKNNFTYVANIQPSSYTALQLTDLNADYWPTATQSFQ